MSLAEAVEAIRARQVIGLPTDTVYGIGADPISEEAIHRLYELKGRPENKAVGLLVASVEQAGSIGRIEGVAARLASAHWPGALTLVVTPRVILADWVGDGQRRTVGLRVPDHPVTLELLEVVGPLAVTSANLAGMPESMTDAEAHAIFGDRVQVYVGGRSPGGQASTVVDVTGSEPVVLRQGPVSI
ncbi:MAG TPA: L-threonylcarbamoyladenylate synthase [Acidimicrobiia bacterium]|nr:L-threonylcarbamoyladenylate synthase [Acidimicrobiia bacterium]